MDFCRRDALTDLLEPASAAEWGGAKEGDFQERLYHVNVQFTALG
jgi:hypothetical protein